MEEWRFVDNAVRWLREEGSCCFLDIPFDKVLCDTFDMASISPNATI